MKKLISLLLLLFSCAGAAHVEKSKAQNKNEILHKIEAIDSINSFYIVYTLIEERTYKIVSKKNNNEGCVKIKTGNSYKLKLESLLSEKIKLGDTEFSSINSLQVDCFYFEENTKICREPDKNIYDLFKSENLNGLCYIDTK